MILLWVIFLSARHHLIKNPAESWERVAAVFCRLFRNLTCLACRDFRRPKQRVPILLPLRGLDLMGWDTDLAHRRANRKQILRGSLTPPLPSGRPLLRFVLGPKFWKCQNDGKHLFFFLNDSFFFSLEKYKPSKSSVQGPSVAPAQLAVSSFPFLLTSTRGAI